MFTKKFNNSPSTRQLRVGELIKRSLAEILRNSSFSETMFSKASITITEVRMSPDLRNATIFLTPLLGTTDKKSFMQEINKISGQIRTEISRKVQIKFSPELFFKFDDSFDNYAHINSLMESLKDHDPIEQ